MRTLAWRQMKLIDRVRWLRYILPPLLVMTVIYYQLGIAQALAINYGHAVHYSVEILFYSLTGPVITWLTLVWVERKLREQQALEAQIQAAEREKAAVLAEDRARIARDLHDGVAQTLYFVALKTDVLRQQLAGDDTAVTELQDMGQKIRQVIREVRRTIFALRPLDWAPGSFIPALRQFIDGFTEQTGWQTAVTLDESTQLPHRLEPVVFRLVQESLNNIAKHAEASQVWITLAGDNGRIHLTIRDDGKGFVPPETNGSGLGMQQMADRVTAVGGQFHLESQPDQGTTITAEIPVGG